MADTPLSRAPDLAEQLAAFNREREILLQGRPIDPEGEPILMPQRPDAEA